jgi:hypothetical protein
MLTQFAADCCNQAIILMVAGHPLLRISPMALEKGHVEQRIRFAAGGPGTVS